MILIPYFRITIRTISFPVKIAIKRERNCRRYCRGK